jgi:predicted amino acid dehydrogenase
LHLHRVGPKKQVVIGLVNGIVYFIIALKQVGGVYAYTVVGLAGETPVIVHRFGVVAVGICKTRVVNRCRVFPLLARIDKERSKQYQTYRRENTTHIIIAVQGLASLY